jgi:hypothetical protein
VDCLYLNGELFFGEFTEFLEVLLRLVWFVFSFNIFG